MAWASVSMPPGGGGIDTPWEVFPAHLMGRETGDDPGQAGILQITQVVWKHIGILSEEQEEVSGEREIWASLFRLLPSDPVPNKW